MHHGYLLWGCYLRFSIYLQKCHFTVCKNAYSLCFMLRFSTACRAGPLGIGVVGGRSLAFGCPSSCHRPMYVHLLRDHGVTNVSFHYHRIRSWSTVPTAHHPRRTSWQTPRSTTTETGNAAPRHADRTGTVAGRDHVRAPLRIPRTPRPGSP